MVGVRYGRFYVRSLRLGKQVRVGQGHMLNTLLAPNVCRFLTEIANDGQPALSPFDWGTLAAAPFLPRLNMKVGPSATVVIAPARWQLQAETIRLSGEEQRRRAGSGVSSFFANSGVSHATSI